MTTATTTRLPQALIDQRRATRRRLRVWARLRSKALTRLRTAGNSIDNDATEEANEPAVKAYLRAFRLYLFTQDRVSAAINKDSAIEAAQLAALRGC